MAVSLSPLPHLHIHPSVNSRALALAVLFSLLLLGVLFFSKRSLEPSLSVYTDLSLPSAPPPPPQLLHLFPSHNRQDSQLPIPPSEAPTPLGGEASPTPSIAGSPGYPISAVSDLDDGLDLDGRVAEGEKPEPPEKLGEGREDGSPKEPRRDGRCDLYDGSWEKDEEGTHPLYRPGTCPYVDGAFACRENGRPDGDYPRWRWKPRGCDLPRFNATDFLERLRGKRLMLVGDSMNRNQFESLLCLLHEALPDKSKMYETRGYKITKGRGYFIFLFVDYNCTVEFRRSHFLVREGTHITPQGKSRPSLLIDRIDKSAARWKHADVLIFNTGHWWTHGKTSKGKDYYQEGDVIYPKFDAVEAYRRAMRTWGRWIDNNMRPGKNLVFYRGYSTAHFRGGDWDSGGTCNGEKEPIFGGAFVDNYPMKMRIVEDAIHEIKFPVILLNVTRLTNFRKDGHPSIYRVNLTEGQKASLRRQDCSHWCLPGVPDAWNELVYASLVLEQTST